MEKRFYFTLSTQSIFAYERGIVKPNKRYITLFALICGLTSEEHLQVIEIFAKVK